MQSKLLFNVSGERGGEDNMVNVFSQGIQRFSIAIRVSRLVFLSCYQFFYFLKLFIYFKKNFFYQTLSELLVIVKVAEAIVSVTRPRAMTIAMIIEKTVDYPGNDSPPINNVLIFGAEIIKLKFPMVDKWMTFVGYCGVATVEPQSPLHIQHWRAVGVGMIRYTVSHVNRYRMNTVVSGRSMQCLERGHIADAIGRRLVQLAFKEQNCPILSCQVTGSVQLKSQMRTCTNPAFVSLSC